MDKLDKRIEKITSQKKDLESRINQNNIKGEKVVLGCALNKVNESLSELNSKKFFEELTSGEKKLSEGILKFVR